MLSEVAMTADGANLARSRPGLLGGDALGESQVSGRREEARIDASVADARAPTTMPAAASLPERGPIRCCPPS